MYTDMKCLMLVVIMIIVTVKSNRVFKMVQAEKSLPHDGNNQDAMDVKE